MNLYSVFYWDDEGREMTEDLPAENLEDGLGRARYQAENLGPGWRVVGIQEAEYAQGTLERTGLL